MSLAAVTLLPMISLGAQGRLNEYPASGASAAQLREVGWQPLTEVQSDFAPAGIFLAWRGGQLILSHAGLPDVTLGASGAVEAPATGPLPDGCEGPVMDDRSAPLLGLHPGRVSERLFLAASSALECAARAGWPMQVDPAGVRLAGKAVLTTAWTAQNGPDEARNQARPASAGAFAAPFSPSVASGLYRPALQRALSRALPPRAWAPPTDWVGGPVISPLRRASSFRTANFALAPGTPVMLLVRDFGTWRSADSTQRTSKTNTEQSFPVFYSFMTWADRQGAVRWPGSYGNGRTVTVHSDRSSWAAARNRGAALLIPLSPTVTDEVRLEPLAWPAPD